MLHASAINGLGISNWYSWHDTMAHFSWENCKLYWMSLKRLYRIWFEFSAFTIVTCFDVWKDVFDNFWQFCLSWKFVDKSGTSLSLIQVGLVKNWRRYSDILRHIIWHPMPFSGRLIPAYCPGALKFAICTHVRRHRNAKKGCFSEWTRIALRGEKVPVFKFKF